MRAVVAAVLDLEPHPNADRLDVLTVGVGALGVLTVPIAKLVTGRHYRVGQLGVYIPPGAIIPGWFAEDMWLVGKGKAEQPYLVAGKPIRGIDSPGLFAGMFYREDKADPRSTERYDKHIPIETPLAGRWARWRYWRDEWQLGDDPSILLDIEYAPIGMGEWAGSPEGAASIPDADTA